MSPLILSWRLAGETIVVVGAGEIAEQKVELLRTTGATIRVIGPDVTPRLLDLAADRAITLVERRVRRRDLRGARLVVAATDDRPLNQRVRRWAHRKGSVVNVVDDPELCDVTVPSVLRRGPATISISTDGGSPASSRFLREQVEQAIPHRVGDLVDHATLARHEIRESGRYRYDYEAWRDRFLSPGLDVIRHGRGSLDELRRRFVAEFGARDEPSPGRVVLVGAGPGGVDLITVRGARALEHAEVVVYDRLVDPALLDLAPSASIRIPVGKSKGGGATQDEINGLMVHHAAAGRLVVRLKGGDPFVFGRGSEERDAVEAAGFECEVVPGITASIAAAGLAGVPVTERGIAASFTVLSGHRAEHDEYDWTALARSGSTLVVMMAASTSHDVAARLLDAGRPPDEPVAAVHSAGRPDMSHAELTLADLAERGCPFPAPSVLVIGRVAARCDAGSLAQLASAAG